MNFSSLAGCPIKARFGVLRALPVQRSKGNAFTYNALLTGGYKAIIENEMPEGSRINFLMNGNKIVFSHKGFSESVHAVAVINNEPVVVKVVLVNEKVIAETLDAQYPSVKIGLQLIMANSGDGSRPPIDKSLVLAIHTQDFSVTHIEILACPFEQDNLETKLDFILNLSERIEISEDLESGDCKGCPYKAICSNETLPVVSCSTCAFFRVNEQSCALGNNQGIRCEQHLYNPVLLVNHKHEHADVQNLFIEYQDFVNSNNPVAGKTVLTSDEMFHSHKFDKSGILDPNIEAFKKTYGAKIVG